MAKPYDYLVDDQGSDATVMPMLYSAALSDRRVLWTDRGRTVVRKDQNDYLKIFPEIIYGVSRRSAGTLERWCVRLSALHPNLLVT